MIWDVEVAALQAQVESLRQRITPHRNDPLRVPSVVEFVLSPQFLNKSTLFARQATLLKVMFLELDTLTPYDLSVIEEWRQGFVPGEHDELLEGRWFEPAPDREFTEGTSPDVLERMALLRARGRRSFKNFTFVAGRRAGKGELASDAIVYVIWQLLALGEPQPHVNAARGKVLTVDVFAGTAQQARENLFADIVRTLVAAPCFAPFVQSVTRDRLVLATPFDLRQPERQRAGTIEIVARETTVLAGRGQSSVIQAYDEMAFVDPANSHAAADDLYAAATPALDQARGWAMILALSSPYQRIGKFYELHRQATEIDEDTNHAKYPEMFTLQTTSWSMYTDSEVATSLPLVPEHAAPAGSWLRNSDGTLRCFPPPGGPPVVDDDELRQKQRADPVRFRVENGGQWGDVLQAFLLEQWRTPIFHRPGEPPLTQQTYGVVGIDYVMHIDPSTRSDPTAYVIGHAEDIDGERIAVIDTTRRWLVRGADIPWDEVYAQIELDIIAFQPRLISVDQHGGVFVVTELRRRIRELPIMRRINVYDIPHTGTNNRSYADVFREAVQRRRVRSYPDRQLQLELQFLQEINGAAKAPSTGPVTTDDVAIATMVVVHHLLGHGTDAHDQLRALRIRGFDPLAPGSLDPAVLDIARRFSALHAPQSRPHNPARGRKYWR